MVISLRLTYRPPYDWPQLLAFLARRAITGVEHIEADRYARTVRMASGTAVVEVAPAHDADALELSIRGGEPSDLLPLQSQVRRMFDLAADPTRIAAVLSRDPLLRSHTARYPGLRIAGTWDVFESGVRAIVGQRVSVSAGRTILNRLIERVGERCGQDRAGLDRLFPTASAVATADFEGLGLPQARAAALREFASAVRDGALPQVLTQLRGVGAWTAGYIALRGLGDPDAFPSGDLVLRQQAAGGAVALDQRTLEKRAEMWRPFRGYAVFQLWRAATTDRNPSARPSA